MFAARETTKRRVGAGLKKRIAYRQHYICTGCKKLLPPTYEVPRTPVGFFVHYVSTKCLILGSYKKPI